MDDVTSRIVIVLVAIVGCVCGSTFIGGFITAFGPLNVVVLRNSSVTFGCRTSSSPAIRWQFYDQLTDDEFIIDGGFGVIVTKLSPRFSVNVSRQSKSNSSELTISSALMSDGGVYQCLEMFSGEQKMSFELIVLESEPVCNIITSSGSNIVRNNDSVEITCQVGYSGNLVPIMDCLSALSALPTLNSSTVTHPGSVNYFFRLRVSTVPREISRIAFTCMLVLERPRPRVESTAKSHHESETVSTFNYTWTSSMLCIADGHPDQAVKYTSCTVTGEYNDVSSKYQTATTMLVATFCTVLLVIAAIVLAIVIRRSVSKRRRQAAAETPVDETRGGEQTNNATSPTPVQTNIDDVYDEYVEIEDSMQQTPQGTPPIYDDATGKGPYEWLGAEFVADRRATRLPSIYDGLRTGMAGTTQRVDPLLQALDGHHLPIGKKGSSLPLLTTNH